MIEIGTYWSLESDKVILYTTNTRHAEPTARPMSMYDRHLCTPYFDIAWYNSVPSLSRYEIENAACPKQKSLEIIAFVNS